MSRYTYPAVRSQLVDRLRAKLERAEDHIRDLEAVWRDFSASRYRVETRDDTHTKERIWYLADAWPIPDAIPLIAGDAIHNLRCALDHLVYYLAWVHTDGKGPFNDLYFHVADTASKFKERLKGKRILPRLHANAIEAIEAIEPYEGGKGTILWHIHRLDIIDKHHLLLAAGWKNPTHSMPPKTIQSYKAGLGIRERLYTQSQEAALFQTKSLAPFPLKAGEVLHRTSIAEANPNMTFVFTVAFVEPEILKGQEIASTLYRASGLIRDIIRKFDELGLLAAG